VQCFDGDGYDDVVTIIYSLPFKDIAFLLMVDGWSIDYGHISGEFRDLISILQVRY